MSPGPCESDAYFAARLLARTGKTNEALADFSRILEIHPDVLLKRRNEALDKLREAIRIQPGQWEAHYLIGLELALGGKFPEAAEQFSEVTRLNPKNAAVQLNLGIALAKLGRIEESKACFRETLRLEPRNQKAAQYFNATEALQKQTSNMSK